MQVMRLHLDKTRSRQEIFNREVRSPSHNGFRLALGEYHIAEIRYQKLAGLLYFPNP
jgi:hypothetical protein